MTRALQSLVRGIFFPVCLVAVACGPRPRGGAHPPSIFAAIPYADAPSSPSAKVFLVAGGDDIANFAAEVVEQRALWEGAGIEPDEIACYYAKPDAAAWRDDIRQYRALADALRGCHRADPARLRTDLRRAAASAPPFVYIYITSHGLPSQLPRRGRAKKQVKRLSDRERAYFAQPAIGLDAGPAPRLGDLSGQLAALREGALPEDILLTPASLATSLSAFPAATVKIAVLQACYSGTFIDHHVAGAPREDRGPTLHDVENLLAISATAAERPSFGCSSGRARTYFGGAFATALSHELTEHTRVVPASIDWERIYRRTAFAVEAMERVSASRSSLPGLIDTRTPAQPQRSPGISNSLSRSP